MSEEAKKQKQVIIDKIKAELEGAKSAVLVNYMGYTVAEADEFRNDLRKENIHYSIYKNTLMKRAVAGTEFEKLAEVMEGPSAIAISKDDATAPARLIKAANKKFGKIEFKAGIVEGEYYDAQQIEEIASIPGREELIARFLGSIQAPVGAFARVIKAIADAKEGGDAPAEA